MQWAAHAPWVPENEMTIEDLRSAALGAIENGTLRLKRHQLEVDVGAAQELTFPEARRELEMKRRPRPIVTFTYLEFTELGAIQWERKWRPAWTQFYDIGFGAEVVDAAIEIIVLRCASWNRLGDLLNECGLHFGYKRNPGVIDLKVTMERPWQATYWKSLDSCYCAVFKVEQGTPQSYTEGQKSKSCNIFRAMEV